MTEQEEMRPGAPASVARLAELRTSEGTTLEAEVKAFVRYANREKSKASYQAALEAIAKLHGLEGAREYLDSLAKAAGPPAYLAALVVLPFASVLIATPICGALVGLELALVVGVLGLLSASALAFCVLRISGFLSEDAFKSLFPEIFKSLKNFLDFMKSLLAPESS